MEISEADMILMKESLGIVRDKRRQGWHLLHNLIDILVIGLSAALCGWMEFEQMEELGLEREAFFKRFLELPNGIPDAYTFNRAFSMVEPAQLFEALKNWYAGSGKSGGRQLNIDGKTIRGSASKGKKAVHMVSLWFGAEHMVIGQKACDEKSNEITAIPELLDQIEVEGDTITIDASDFSPRAARRR